MQSTPTLRRIAALVLMAGLLDLAGGAAARVRTDIPGHPSERTIWHVLNRVTFGPRPGDVIAVQKQGLDAFLDQQLHPERIDNRALDSRLAGFETLTMSSAELAKKYFVPALQLRRKQAGRQQRTTANAKRAPASSDAAGSTGSMTPQEESMTAGTPAPSDAPAKVSPELQAARMEQQAAMNELMQAKVLRAAFSDRQLEEVLTDFWLNHFNVFVGKGQVRQYLTAYERDAIRPHVLGSFRDLLGAVAHSPAMLFYLDNWQSASPNAKPALPPGIEARLNDSRLRPEQRQQLLARLQQQMAQRPRAPRGINENYAREIMELHTLGVDAGYTQQDVIELARILTGWTIDRPQQGGSFVFKPEMHDPGTKTFLGKTFAGTGQSEGEQALDLLARHPATAHHIAYELSQRFVADEPPTALVDRAAKKFLDTKGDLREVVRLILTSPEFLADDAYRAKVKTPLEFVVSAVRATGADVTNAQPLVAALRNLGMPLYGCQPPTGYSTTADAWVNTGALLNRMNFAVQLVSGGRIQPNDRPGRGAGAPDAAIARQRRLAGAGRGRQMGLRGPLQVDVTSLAPDTSAATLDRLVQLLLAGDVSAGTRQTLARAETPPNLVALTLGSPEFQRR